MKKDLRYWLALLRMPGYGPAKLNQLINTIGNISILFEHTPAHLPEQVKCYCKNPDWEQVENDLAWLQESHRHFIPISSDHYPKLLRNIPDPPIGLFAQGDIDILNLPQIAIVGSRNPSASGLETAKAFASFLGQSGLAITSGMAMGIDGAAHSGALSAGAPTIAVAGTGLDRVYPAQHQTLAHEIANTGCLVSEYPPGTPAIPGNFPKRNRIISGLSIGTLVVEAALRSGSLITARLALEQGREIFAIPGSIHNPLARGCHNLIRQGAKLVETAEDIIEELSSLFASLPDSNLDTSLNNNEENASNQLDPDYHKLLENMGFDPISTDHLIARTGFSAAAVSSMLLLLELEGHVSSAPGGYFTRTHNIV